MDFFVEDLAQRDGHAADLRRKILLFLVDVDADAGDQIIQGVGFTLQTHLRQNACQLAAGGHKVVGPLDPGPEAADRLDPITDRHRHPGGKVHGVLGLQCRAQKGGEVDSLALWGIEGAPPASPASGLGFRGDHQPFLGAGEGPALALRIGGVHRVQADQSASHQTAAKGSHQLSRPDPVQRTVQTVSPFGGGSDVVALFAQGVHRLPDCGPADPELLTHKLTGEVRTLVFQEHGENLFLKHGVLLRKKTGVMTGPDGCEAVTAAIIIPSGGEVNRKRKKWKNQFCPPPMGGGQERDCCSRASKTFSWMESRSRFG